MVAGMKRWLWLLIVAVGLMGTGARAADAMRASKPEVRKEVLDTIEGQLAAFRAKDPKKAYGFAATALKAQTPQRQFTRIVEANYPEIWANVKGEFGVVRDDGKRATVTVQVFSKEGRADYDYGLVKEADGWRIDSVLRHPPDRAGKV